MSKHKALNAVAYEHLRDMIYNSELEFNRVYSETRLAAQLSISRTPIRDALNRLAQERYIDILPNRGFILHFPTQSDITSAYHMRMMAESYCARLVARDYPDAKARGVIDQMEDALERQQFLMEDAAAYDLNRFWMDDLRFHKALLEYIGLSTLMLHYERAMYTFMPHHLVRHRDGEPRQPQLIERHRSTLVEHAEITEALKSHDPVRVEAAIRTHVDTSLRALYLRMEA